MIEQPLEAEVEQAAGRHYYYAHGKTACDDGSLAPAAANLPPVVPWRRHPRGSTTTSVRTARCAENRPLTHTTDPTTIRLA